MRATRSCWGFIIFTLRKNSRVGTAINCTWGMWRLEDSGENATAVRDKPSPMGSWQGHLLRHTENSGLPRYTSFTWIPEYDPAMNPPKNDLSTKGKAVLAYFHPVPNTEVLQCLNKGRGHFMQWNCLFFILGPVTSKWSPSSWHWRENIHQCRSINGELAVRCKMYFCQNLLSVNAHLLWNC